MGATIAGLAAWRETAPAKERDWVANIGFTGEAGKLALVPDKAGKLRHVLVGRAEVRADLMRQGPRHQLALLPINAGLWVVVAEAVARK